ncbi:TetR/AcrR family transcriptional regulator [Embleya scabrispora]|uniref:TetR/AcrR family transcriptional regulator n=1 Tax=Embleya scabrispora TaxID=159449 RepID=UPI0003755E50|nr:TetR/AcrR family transcriptional regulator [Embleya scabrispora]MYS87626.1 TetR family transcriptional regulator [Streptomyces sp. SID5474]
MAEPLAADLRADGHTDWRAYDPLLLPPILAASLAAFDEHGYHGTTVRDIARRVGVTVPALYYHYQNKQALLVELLIGSMNAALGRCRGALAEADDAPTARFAALVECIVLYMANRAPLAFLDTEMRSLEPDNRARYVAMRDELEALMHDAVRDGVALGEFTTPYPVDAGRAVITCCQAVANWYRPTGPLTPQQIANRYVTISLATVGHTPGLPKPGPAGA